MSPKDAALSFLHLVAAHREAEAFDQHVGAGFKHHNPFTPAGAAELRKGMTDAGKAMPEMRIQVLRAIAEGDLVAVHSRLQFNPGHKGMAVVHLFRFEQGRIVELWDVGQQVPDDLKNADGMF